MSGIDQFLAHYGYFAIFALLMLGIVGPLIPDETILVACGIFVHRGQLQFLPVVFVGLAGSVCGITVSYAIGLYGFGWLERHWPWLHRFAQEHLAKPEQWFARFGKWTLFFGYFIAGLRHFSALFAGVSRMEYREFSVPAYSGAFFWVLSFVSIGYFVGDQWSKYATSVDRGILILAVMVTIAAVVVALRHRRQTK